MLDLTQKIKDLQSDLDFIGDAMEDAYKNDDQVGLLKAWYDYTNTKSKLASAKSLKAKIQADMDRLYA